MGFFAMVNRNTGWILLALVLVAGFLLLRQTNGDLALNPPAAPRTVAVRTPLPDAEALGVQIFAEDSPAVVQVVGQTRPAPTFGAGGAGGVQNRGGFVWDAAGHVVTNNHVVDGTTSIRVRLANGDVTDASVIGTAPTYDLAVLQIAAGTALPTPIALGTSTGLKVGQYAFAIGNPFGLGQTMTSGIVSALKRRLPTSAGRDIAGVIQTDASINPGNSGGPLLDSAGRLIGVTTAIISPSGTNAGIGFAIPVDVVNRIVPELIASGRVPVPGIGVVVPDESAAASANIDRGLVVLDVVPGSPAAKAGLRGVDRATGALGDVILSVDGAPVHLPTDLTDAIEQAGVGKTVQLKVTGSGGDRTLDVAVVDISA
jgi:S1-C subfamily serine protease